jgi:undecaprenyl diphosphate synthase
MGTQKNQRITLAVAANYGGQWDIVQAFRNWQAANPHASASELTQDKLSEYLSTAGIPDVDLLIRTGGEMRISNFLLWQSAYAEFYFTEELWPDFDRTSLDKALECFNQRMRRFGKTREQVKLKSITMDETFSDD